MDRYAVINSDGEVVNVIVWDGITDWKPPEGHRIEKNEDVGRGDIWLERINDFVRPLKNAKTPEDELSIMQRKDAYEASKDKFRNGFALLDDAGNIDSLVRE